MAGSSCRAASAVFFVLLGIPSPSQPLWYASHTKFQTGSVILLLVSPDFIASEYCYNKEMTRAVERHSEGSATVIPVILRPCHWHRLPFGHLLAAPRDGKPVTEFTTLDAGFYQVVGAINDALKNCPVAPQIDRAKAGALDPSQSTRDATVAPPERSSNLRIKRSFTDRDRDRALTNCFEFVARFFANSLEELQRREQAVEGQVKKIDGNSFEVAVYVGGKRRASCGIWIDRSRHSNAICFNHSGVTPNSYNESVSVEDDGYTLGFKPMGLPFRQVDTKQLLTAQGVGEYLWDMLMEGLR